MQELSKLAKNKLQPVTFDLILREPYGVKPLRKMIDGCAFRIYGHWVKRNNDENQNRAALFENKPHKEKYNGNGHTCRKTGILESYNASFRMTSLGQIQYKSVRQKPVHNWNHVGTRELFLTWKEWRFASWLCQGELFILKEYQSLDKVLWSCQAS